MLFQGGEKIVFAGDSVTDDGRARPIGEGGGNALGNGYVKLIDCFFNVDCPEKIFHLVNMGVSGNTSRDLLGRWDADVNALSPDWVVLCIGFNDVWRQFDCPCVPERSVSPEEYRANLSRIAERTQAKKRGIPCIDLQAEFAHILRYRYPAYLTWDRVHPGPVGSLIIARAFLREIGFTGAGKRAESD